MSEIYIYDSSEKDFSRMGLVGALTPTECKFSETLNGESLLSFSHPIDKFGRYAALQNGCIVLAKVPVRTFPILDDRTSPSSGEPITVWTYAVKDVSWGVRKLFRNITGSWAYNIYVNAGDKVTVTYIPSEEGSSSSDDIRYRVIYNGTTGWLSKNALDESAISSRTIPYGSESIQEIASPWKVREQYFRIYEVKKGIDSVQVSARHISYDLLYNMTTWQSEESVSLFTAIRGVMDNLYDQDTPFKVYTNVNNSQAGIFTKRMNPINAFLDPEEGICKKFGVDLMRDNYDLYFLDDPGINRGVVIQYGKNMTGIDFSYSIDEVATRIIPIGEDANGNDVLLQDTFTSTEVHQLAENFSTTTQYEVGNLCAYSDKLYRCKTRHIGNWNANNFSEVKKDYVDSTNIGSYPSIHIYELKCENCKIGEGGIDTLAQCKTEMRRQANKLLTDGCDQPKIEMSVEFINLGDTVQYKQFKNLENCFIGDYIIVRHPDLDIDVTAQIVKMEWDVLLERMESVEVGTPGQTLSNTGITTWQIPSGFSGSKIAEGTIDSRTLKENIINTRHLQAETITAEKIAGETITADKIVSGTITADKFNSDSVNANTISAVAAKIGTLSAESVSTDTLAANIANFLSMNVQSFTSGSGTVKHLVSNVFNLDGTGTLDDVWIRNLSVSYAQIIEATLGSLVLKASNGNYYKIDIDANGTLVATDVTSSITNTEKKSGKTSDGKRSIVETSMSVSDFSSENIKSTVASINKIYASLIDTDTLLARQAFIDKLYTSQIFGGRSLQLMVQTESNIRNWFTFDTKGLTVKSQNGGIATRTSSESFSILNINNESEYGVFTMYGLDVPAIKIGGLKIMGGMEADGGMVWVDEDTI